MHLGPLTFPGYSCPFLEDETKGPEPLSYFDQEKVLESRSKLMGFSYSVVRPGFIIGLSPRMNGKKTQSLGLVIAVYATVLKAEGLPLYFPGSVASWKSSTQLSTSQDIAKISIWASTNTACRNQAFNIPSSSRFSWADGTWDSVAKFFGMKSKAPRKSTAGFSCKNLIGREGQQLWTALKDEGLVRRDLSFCNVFNPDFFDKSFSPCWDATFSDLKLKKFGYNIELVPAIDVLRAYFSTLVEEKIIPNPTELRRFLQKSTRVVSSYPGSFAS